MRNRNDLVWIPIIENQTYWASTITGFKWGYHDNKTRFPPEQTTEMSWTAQTARLNSGWYDIVGPTTQVDLIRKKICEELSDASLFTWCNHGLNFAPGVPWNCGLNKSLLPVLPSFYFEFGYYWFEVQPDDYIQLTEENRSDCQLRFVADDTIDGWFLGLGFMQGWYIVHQYLNKQMGFVPHYFSTKTVPICSTAEACEYTIAVPAPATGDNDVLGSTPTTITEIQEVIVIVNGEPVTQYIEVEVENKETPASWTLITIGLIGSMVLGIMLIAYLLCPSMLGLKRKRKTMYVPSHNEGVLLRQSHSTQQAQQKKLEVYILE